MPLSTTHTFRRADARAMPLADASVDAVVTSPPYPLVRMWDACLASWSPALARALGAEEHERAFSLAHAELDRAWSECFRVLREGGIACVNVGDATRTTRGEFRLFPNHARVLEGMARAGFTPLPDILWRKPTNAPNKFMGSGMLPAGAYVTYEHEYILLFRKGRARAFEGEARRLLRRRSAYFWEERNRWFSDVWTDLPGAGQAWEGAAARERSGAFPLELPHRLVSMFSVQGDAVLDPFAGTGTTALAALAAARSSVSLEIDAAACAALPGEVAAGLPLARRRVEARLAAHRAVVEARTAAGKPWKHENAAHGFPVVTRQETDLGLLAPVRARRSGEVLRVTHGLARERAGRAEPARAAR